ncbi:MAG: adenylate/guanylate cyclase domain-containing protein [Betaproteobacteria bacterium]
MKLHLARIILGLAITLFFTGHAARLYEVGFIHQLDNIIYDARLRLTMPGTGDARIVILDIDEKSLAEIGRWPWSRNVMARLMDRLFDQYAVSVVAFDVVWAERDPSSGLQALDALAKNDLRNDAAFQSAYRQMRPGLDYDALFAASMKGRPVVLGYYLSSEENAARANAIPAPVLPKGAFAGRPIPFTQWQGYTGNLPAYLASAAGAGHINPIIDDDGIVRRVPMLAELDGAYYEAFSLAVVRTLLAVEGGDGKYPAVEPGFPQDGYGSLEWLKVGPLTIPVDENAAALVPYRGKRFSYLYLSLADVLAGRIKPEQLKGKLAIVGTTVPSLQDLRSTPVDTVYPGVEVHANLIAGMINRAMKSKPGYILGAEVAFLLAAGIAFSLLVPMLSAVWATMAAAAGLALISGFNLLVWNAADAVLPLAASLLMTASIYIMNMAYGYFVETRSKRQFTELFGQYAPPELVARMAADPEKYRKYSMVPKAAELTILFSDVRGFTGISEALKPEELREYINEYLTVMSGIIRSEFHGTLDKYIGDAIMAFWGAPVEDPQHARNGVLAGMQMQKECEVLNAKFAARGWSTLRIGVGLNSGNVRVGDMGSQVRRAYTVMGDAVNVASRLEGRTKHYGVGILVGEATRNAVNDVVFREVDRIRVKGKDAAVTVYEPIGLDADVDPHQRAELELWSRALRAYRARQWDQADADLSELQRRAPDCALYQVFSGKVAEKRRSPPASDWDGITVFDEK